MRWPWARASAAKESCGRQGDGANCKLCGWIHGRVGDGGNCWKSWTGWIQYWGELDRAVAQEAEQRAAACSLMEQAGVGPVTALMFVLTIGPVERFRRSKQVVSYLGLNPRESSRGGRQRFGAIRKQGNSMAGFLLVEGAQTAARYDAELRRDYQRLKFRRGTAVAKIAIARKLAVRLYWKLRQQNSALPPTGMPGSPEHPVVGASLSRN